MVTSFAVPPFVCASKFLAIRNWQLAVDDECRLWWLVRGDGRLSKDAVAMLTANAEDANIAKIQ
jgi:hypothetical protein